MRDLFRSTKILPLTSESAFQLFCTNILQHKGLNQHELLLAWIQHFYFVGITANRKVVCLSPAGHYIPEACAHAKKLWWATTGNSLLPSRDKDVKYNKKAGGLQFSLMKKRGKITLLHAESIRSRREMCRENSLLRQDKKKIARIFCCLQSCGLPRKIWVYIDWYCTYTAADFSHSLLHSPSCILPSSESRAGHGVTQGCHWALWLLSCLLWSSALTNMGRFYYFEWHNENNIATAV